MKRNPYSATLLVRLLTLLLLIALVSSLGYAVLSAPRPFTQSVRSFPVTKSTSQEKRPSSITVNWTIAASMIAARGEHTATLLSNGKILVAGGNGDTSLSSCELYDPAANTWSTTGSLSTARAQHTATLLLNGKVLIVGGFASLSGPLGSTELYDPASGIWSNAASLATARFQHTATLLGDGKVLVTGGAGNGGILNSAEIYDPSANTWTTVASLASAREQHRATLLASGFVVVSGGIGNAGNFLASAERYNPGNNTWTSAGSMSTSRIAHTATLLQSGKVLVAGTGGFTTLATADLYDPAANTWTATAAMSATRESHSATLLTSGKVLVAGGYGSGSASAELFDPATSSWSETAGLNEDRASHSATLLANGKVLIAGGYGNTVLASAELYDPLAGSNGGRKIAFGSSRNNGNHDIYVMDLDGTNQVRLTTSPAYDDQPKWSPDGTKLVFMSKRDGNFEIYTMNADGTTQTSLTNNALADGFPAWSPTGAKIAFVRGDLANPTTFEIYVMNADGSNQVRLTNDSLIDGVPMWSPDSTKLVFMSGATGLLDSNSFEIYTINADGSNRTRLTTNTVVDGQPSYSPDGSRILFGSGDMMSPTGLEIYVMNANGSNRTRLTNNAMAEGFPAWSPDGSQIVYCSGDVGDESVVELFTMNADGSNPIRLTNNSVLDWFPDWQPGNTYSISGQVRDVSGNPLSGISIALTGTAVRNATTDGSGNYSFGNLTAGGNHVVTPSSSTYTFSPASVTFTNLNVDRIGNFVGSLNLVTISGRVTDANNNAVNNVNVSLTKNGTAAGTVQTNAQGEFNFANQTAGANYVVTPTGSFSPSSQTLSNLTANATANFKAALSIPPQCSTVNFLAAANYPVQVRPANSVLGDFNGDGKLDVAISNIVSNSVSIFVNDGMGGFGPGNNINLGTLPAVGLAIGDFNSDQKLDIVVAQDGAVQNVAVLFGDGAGAFTVTGFSTGSYSSDVAVADFNLDGKQDLAVTNTPSGANPNSVSILLGDGAGHFGAPSNFAVGSQPIAVVTQDLNGDGRLDLIISNYGSNSVSVLIATGGLFGLPTTIPIGTAALSIAVADLSGDGKPDLVTSDVNSANVKMFLGTGSGGFGPATNIPAGTTETTASVGVADLNGDGKLDVAVAHVSNGVSVLLGDGRGSFSPSGNFVAGAGPRAFSIGDLNGDGNSDFAVPNFDSNNLSILLNSGPSCNATNSLSISGSIANASNTALTDTTVTLSGPITRVTTTDASGNYSFVNLVPGGNYTVTVQTTYFIISPSRVDFFNLSSNQVANFIAAPLAVPLPTPPFTDDFSSPIRDATKWTIGAQTEPPTAFDPQVTTAQVNGQLVITPLSQVVGLHYAGYVSANSFDMRNGRASVELVRAATGGADSIFAIGTDVDNFYRFMVHTTGTPTSLAPRARGRDGVERPLDTTVAQLIFQVNVNGMLTSLSINYDPVQHRFMRFRHEPPTNSIVFETSPDNIAFTVQHTVVLLKSVSALTAELSAGTTNPTNPGPAVFDNFSLVTSTFQFSAGSYAVNEGDGSIIVTVTRAGSLTDAASVDFSTSDGTARQKTRYTSAAGTLAFAAGIATRTFRVLLVDNQLTEGDQTLNLLLSNPVGSGLNSPGRAILTISDNDTTLATTNQLDDARYFVTQHYYDFLSRVPDQSGLDYWTGQITMCGTDVNCLRTQRITVSNAFFYEQEYQQTGSYVVRVYRAAYGDNQPIPNNDANPAFPNENKKLVNYSAFSPDRARVRGGPSLAQTQLDLANAFVLRSEFLARYPGSLNGPAYVDALLANINTDIGIDLSSQRAALLDLFNQGGRGAVLYRLADDNAGNPINNRAFIDAEYNRAFVLTQYFGYLRRNPDIGGFIFWLGQVNSAPLRALEKQRAMVCSFITSLEYQQRFSPVATHNNTECQ